MRYKKAQAAGLIATILGLIILYILFLPPSEREALLEDDDDGYYYQGDDTNNITLLSENPGTLSYISQKDADQGIPNIYLTETTNAKEIERFNAFYVRNGWFNKAQKNLTFEIKDLENTDNVFLTFSTPVNRGTLTILLNDHLVYEYDISGINVDPIELKDKYLTKENSLVFEVSGVGIRFWDTNEYGIENVRVIGDVTDTSKQKSSNVFTLSNAEYQNLDKASLKFVPYCDTETEVGVLEVSVNKRTIYSAVPVCDDPVYQSFSTDILNEGENDVIFISHDGSYSVEQISFELPLKASKTVSYYFELNESSYDDVINGSMDVLLTLDMVDDDEDKKGEINVNGHKTTFDQEEPVYDRKINSWIEEGNNYLEIRPKSDLHLVEVRVELIEN